MKKTNGAIFGISLFILVLYIFLAMFARNGWGYMGYFGYYNGPSYWYWHDTSYYYDKSSRNGSISGTNQRGGGPGRGK